MEDGAFGMSLFLPALRVMGVMLKILSLLLMLPVIKWSDNKAMFASYSMFLLVIGLAIAFGVRRKIEHINSRQMFIITVANWLGISILASIPYILSNLHLSVSDAVFESISGITTTGSTVLTGLDRLPEDILLWRSITQWVGGVGIIGMAVVILPFLKVGGMRLFRTESSDWSDKEMPQTQKFLSYLVSSYVILTVLCAFAYAISGMTVFEAVNHAMTTISTGGYSTSDLSLGHYKNHAIHWIAVVFMILGSIPFVIYVQLISHRRITVDQQVKAFFLILFASSAVLASYLYIVNDMDLTSAVTQATLNVTSIVTTTGFVGDNYAAWGDVSLCIFFFLTFIGGCSGSTSGGVKVFRFQMFFLILREQIIKSVHPRAIVNLQYNKKDMSKDVIDSSISFIFMIMVSIFILTLLLSFTGLDLVTSLTGSITALMNVGPGMGDIIGPAGNFHSLPDSAKWILCMGMLLGRLELLTIVVLFSPVFWRG